MEFFKFGKNAAQVVRAGHPLLRIPSTSLQKSELNSSHVQDCLQLMKRCYKSPYLNCIGLSAPQVGYSYRIISWQILDKPTLAKHKLTESIPLTFMINPQMEITDPRPSSEWDIEYESCESIPGYNGLVSRPSEIRVNGWNEHGQNLVLNATGLLSRVIQHEIDHLDGILFTEKMIPKSFRRDEYIDVYEYHARRAR